MGSARYVLRVAAVVFVLILGYGIGKSLDDNRTELSLESSPEPVQPTTASQRAVYGNRLEEQYLKMGLDIYVTVEDTENRTIQLRWVLVSRPMAYQTSHDQSFLEVLRTLGFTKLVLTDGYEETWSYGL